MTGLLLDSMFDSLTCLRKLMVGERTASEWRQHQLNAATDAAKVLEVTSRLPLKLSFHSNTVKGACVLITGTFTLR